MDEIVSIVDVQTGAEVSRAILAVDGTVTYAGGESARGVVEQLARDDGTTTADAVRKLRRVGWSNGYLMVDLH